MTLELPKLEELNQADIDALVEVLASTQHELQRLYMENNLLASASDKLRVSWSREVRALIAENDGLRAQRDSLLEALKEAEPFLAAFHDPRGLLPARKRVRLAIKAVEENT